MEDDVKTLFLKFNFWRHHQLVVSGCRKWTPCSSQCLPKWLIDHLVSLWFWPFTFWPQNLIVTFLPNCTEVVNLVKFPQAVVRCRANDLYSSIWWQMQACTRVRTDSSKTKCLRQLIAGGDTKCWLWRGRNPAVLATPVDLNSYARKQ